MATPKGLTDVNIDLPCDQNGEIDWNTLGNILTAHLLGEVLCASYVDHRHGHRKADFQADTDWKFSYKKDDIVVLKKQFEKSQHTTFMGRGMIDAPLHDVAALIKDIRNNYIWDKFIVEAKYLKVLSQSETHTDYMGYQRFESAQCFLTLKRDMLYYVRCIYIDGKYVQSAISVEDPDYPACPDITRVEVFAGTGFVVEPYQGSSTKTLVSYLGNGDFKRLPQFIMTQVLKRHPLAIRYIRSHFMRPQNEQQQKEAQKQHQHKLPQLVFERSTEAESNATPQLPLAKPYEEAMPIGDFMSARSGMRSYSESSHNLDHDLQTPPELRVHSATSQTEADLVDQSPTSELYTNTRGDFKQDENI